MNRWASIFCLIALCSCAGRPSVKAPVAGLRDFPSVQLPSMISDSGEAMEYVANNYWNSLADTSRSYLCDSTHVAGVDAVELERQFGNFAGLLWRMEPPLAAKAVSAMYANMEKCERKDSSSNVFDELLRLSQKYFYDPNSPLRNEDMYLPLLKALAGSDLCPEGMRPAYEFDARMCSLNSYGSVAADFSFTRLDGRRERLLGIKAPFTLLLFSNPGCPSCKDIMETLMGTPEFTALVDGGTVAVVNVYIDRELDKWQEYAKVYPTSWHSGYDHNYIIREDLLYNVRAIPSVYLLDGEKRVIMKDAPVEKLFERLEQIAIMVKQIENQ